MNKYLILIIFILLSSFSLSFASDIDNLPLVTEAYPASPVFLQSSTPEISPQSKISYIYNQFYLLAQSPVTVTDIDSSSEKNDPLLVAQQEADDPSHHALSTAVQDKEMFYYIKASGAVPLYDESFKDYLDYGVSVSFGAGKHMDDKLSLSVSLDILMLTGDWSIKGDRKSIEVAAEEWAEGVINNPSNNGITPEAEDLPDRNLGTGYHSDAEAIITSSESLKKIDIHTDLYMFPVMINALYKLNKIGNFRPYVGGGLGYCLAIRDSDSKAVKDEYFNGPEYMIALNDSQTRSGMVLNFLGGFSTPVYKNMIFVAEGNMTYYDLDSFDPIMEISLKTPANPSSIQSNDITTYSYEDPKRFGEFGQELVGQFSIGIIMPF